MDNTGVQVKRVEYKYLISAEQAAILSGRLSRGMIADSHNGPAGYRVKSLYFDTQDNDDFFEKEAGIHSRNKIRLRLYDENAQTVLLERKQKQGEYQVKLSLPLLRQQAALVANGVGEPLLEHPHPQAPDMYYQVLKRRPVLMVEYRRTAFLWPVHNTRITLDREICCTKARLDLFDPHLPYVPLGSSADVVLEVKYDVVLEPYIRELIAPFCGSRLSFGKYERGMQML